MHSVDFPPEADKKGSFHFNSDFSGDVKVTMEIPAVPGSFVEVEIPGVALTRLLETIIEYRLGNVREDIADLIIKQITKT
jgi:hypothetical protein